MKFTSDRQRKAMFAQINKFAAMPRVFDYPGGVALSDYLPEPEVVQGYTGATLVSEPKTKEVIAIRTPYGTEEKPRGETIILAGEKYGAGGFGKADVERLVEKGAVDTGVPQIEVAEYVARAKPLVASEFERLLLGRPVYSVLAQKEYIPGGYADGRPDGDFDPEQIQKGIEVEKEHVIKFTDKGNVRKFKDSDFAKAKEISKDHLCEIPDYYDRLEAMEEGAKEEGVFIDVAGQKLRGD